MWIRNGEDSSYRLTREGEQPVTWSVDRAAIAACLADLVETNKGLNESLGLTN